MLRPEHSRHLIANILESRHTYAGGICPWSFGTVWPSDKHKTFAPALARPLTLSTASEILSCIYCPIRGYSEGLLAVDEKPMMVGPLGPLFAKDVAKEVDNPSCCGSSGAHFSFLFVCCLILFAYPLDITGRNALRLRWTVFVVHLMLLRGTCAEVWEITCEMLLN